MTQFGKRILRGLDSDYILFFGYQCFLSNFYRTSLVIDGVTYNCSEQAFQALKAGVLQSLVYLAYAFADLFGDIEAARLIRTSVNPLEQKQIGRYIFNYDQAMWERERDGVMKRCLMAKFSQSADLRLRLELTNDSILVESSAYDKYWGNGLSLWSADCIDSDNWPGLNRLGDLLMEVRSDLQRA